MKYLIFPSFDMALQRSHNIAVEQGAGKEGDVTQYWFGTIEHEDGRAAMEVSDEALITDAEKLELKDENWMENDGWLNTDI